MIGALVRRELLGSGRKGRFFLLRAFYLAVLACITIPTLLSFVREIQHAARFGVHARGTEFTLYFGWLQLALAVLLAPALSVTALAAERASGALELLAVAGVGPVKVVLGKIAARMAWLGLVVLSGLPLLTCGTLMGGAGFELVALILVHSLAAGFFGTAIGLAASGAFRQPLPAILASYGILAVAYLVPIGWFLFYAPYHYNQSTLRVPFVLCAPTAIEAAALGLVPSSVAWLALLPPLGLGLLAMIAAVPLARVSTDRGGAATLSAVGVAMLEGSAAGVRAARTGAERRSAPVHGNPVAWREARSHRFGFWSRVLRLAYVCAGGAVAVHLLVFALLAEAPGFARVGVAALALGGAAVALVVSASALAPERDSRVLGLLTLSELTPFEILSGKLIGLARFLWPVIALPAVPALAFLRFDVAAFPMSVLLAAMLLLSAAALGLAFATLVRRAIMAVGLAVGLAVAWQGLVPFLIVLGCSNATAACDGDALFGGMALSPVVAVTFVVSGFAPATPTLYGYSGDPFDGHLAGAGWLGVMAVAAAGALAFAVAVVWLELAGEG